VIALRRFSFVPTAIARVGALALLGLAECGTSTGGTSADGGGGLCARYDDQTATVTVSVKVVNATAAPIYLGDTSGCSVAPIYTLADASGSVEQLVSDACGHTCEDLQTQGPSCPNLCAVPPVIHVDPGGSYSTTWSGDVYRPMNTRPPTRASTPAIVRTARTLAAPSTRPSLTGHANLVPCRRPERAS
jgi:hypothetical protein